jgi:hypothetical protein
MGLSDAFRVSAWVTLPVAAIAITFFGSITIFAVYRLITGCGVTVDARGLTDRSLSVSAAGLVAWDDIVAIDAVPRVGQPFVRLRVGDPAGLASRMSPAGRLVSRWNGRGRAGAYVWLAMTGLDVGADELACLPRNYQRVWRLAQSQTG